jgi:hypothetical protein
MDRQTGPTGWPAAARLQTTKQNESAPLKNALITRSIDWLQYKPRRLATDGAAIAR